MPGFLPYGDFVRLFSPKIMIALGTEIFLPPDLYTDIGSERSEGAIRLVVFQKWEAAGKPDSDGVDFWLDAERELLARTVS